MQAGRREHRGRRLNTSSVRRATGSRPPAISSITSTSSWPTTSLCTTRRRWPSRCKSRARPSSWPSIAFQLAAAEPFEAQPLEQMTHAFVEAQGVKIGDIVHALRAAVTGQSVGLGLFDSLAILGKASCLARIERTLKRMEAAKV